MATTRTRWLLLEIIDAEAWLADLEAGNWPRGRAIASKQMRMLEKRIAKAQANLNYAVQSALWGYGEGG